MTIGSGKDPSRLTFAFERRHRLAAGDDDLEPDDPSLRVATSRTTADNALDAAIAAMQQVSSRLAPSHDYDARFAEFQRSSGEQTRNVTTNE